MCDKLDKNDFEVMAVVTRNMRLRRNFLVHEGDSGHLNQIVWKAIKSLQEYIV
jgi:hypothetical protein